jgi:hypothetical protein
MKRAAALLVFTAVILGTASCSREPCTGGTDPGGTPCAGNATVCNRNCVCENGDEIQIGTCSNDACVSAASACTLGCANYGFGGFSGQLCEARPL